MICLLYRVDVCFSFENCDANRIKEMFDASFPNVETNQKDRFHETLEKNLKKTSEQVSISPMDLQRHFLKFSLSSSDAIENFHLLKENQPKQTDADKPYKHLFN